MSGEYNIDNNVTTEASIWQSSEDHHKSSSTPLLTVILQLTTRKVGSTHGSQRPVFYEVPKQEYVWGRKLQLGRSRI